MKMLLFVLLLIPMIGSGKSECPPKPDIRTIPVEKQLAMDSFALEIVLHNAKQWEQYARALEREAHCQ